MLQQLTDGTIQENAQYQNGNLTAMQQNSANQLSNIYSNGCNSWPYQTSWYGYPVYVCSDKTKKAIEVLKALQDEKLLKCESVPRFIALVEKISNLL